MEVTREVSIGDGQRERADTKVLAETMGLAEPSPKRFALAFARFFLDTSLTRRGRGRELRKRARIAAHPLIAQRGGRLRDVQALGQPALRQAW